MSREATDWAFDQRTERPADHHVLLILANAVAKGTTTAFPSIAAIGEATGLNRKMVIDSLARLRDARLIKDTGLRVGEKQQIKVYHLAIRAPIESPIGDA